MSRLSFIIHNSLKRPFRDLMVSRLSFIISHLSFRFSLASLALVVSMTSFAQGGTVSPYSQYAFGEQAVGGGSYNRGMNGLGYALNNGAQVNPLNPASYASVDSLTMLFDMGLSGQITNFNENGTKLNRRQASFEYIMGSFRAWKNVGVTFGLLPITNIGYEYTTSTKLTDASKTTVETVHGGEGGLHQLFVGVGVRPIKNLAVGANFAYLWGDLERGVATTTVNTFNALHKVYRASVSSYNVELGLQYYQPIGKDNMLTIGAKYSLGHKLGSDPECMVISSNSQISKADTTSMKINNGLELPHILGAGVSYRHGAQWVIGADVELQRWSKTEFPEYSNGKYTLQSGFFDDRYRLAVGGELCPRWNSRNFFHRIRYRVGAGYTTPYYKINGQDGPREISATIGFGIPIMNAYNNRSFLNISAQYVNNSATGLIKENTFRINIGLTFNEKWFAKWKVE